MTIRLAALVLAMALMIAGCAQAEEPVRRINSISYVVAADNDRTLTARYVGGPCQSFSDAEVDYGTTQVEISVFVLLEPGDCPSMAVFYDASIILNQPLGERRIIDGSTKEELPHLRSRRVGIIDSGEYDYANRTLIVRYRNFSCNFQNKDAYYKHYGISDEVINVEIDYGTTQMEINLYALVDDGKCQMTDSAQPISIKLDQPLGARTVVDGHTNKVVRNSYGQAN